MKIFFILVFLSVQLILKAQGYICAIGGGGENYNDWSDEPYSWIAEKSDSGKVIILSFSDATNWIPDYFISFGSSEAYNKKINSKTIANNQSTYDELITAHAIFIKGGDQWNYINTWKGTLTEDAINFVFQKGGVIAGTSAGAAVLGDLDFSAKNGSAYSDESLINPFNSNLQFEDDFLDLIPEVLFDQHFIERGRFGRLISMIFNAEVQLDKNITGVGIDDRTAICIEPNGIGTVMGSGAVAIFYKDQKTNFLNSASSYTIENLKCDQLTAGWSFDFSNNSISYIPSTAKNFNVEEQGYPLTNFWLTGTNNLTANLPNLEQFLNQNNHENILLVSHPGYLADLSPLIDFLSSQNFNYSLLLLTADNLNDNHAVQQINDADCFLFTGDSLNILSLLNNSSSSASQAFYNSINSNPVFFFGNAGKISGESYIDNVDSDYLASWRGRMKNQRGLSIFKDLIYQPLLFEDSDFYENRTSALLWGIMINRKPFGIYSSGNEVFKINKDSQSISGTGEFPFLIIDARNTTFVDSSVYVASGGAGTRQIVAMNNLRYSITTNNENEYLIESGTFQKETNVNSENFNTSSKNFYLNNYPNPFNYSTRIKFNVDKVVQVNLKVYDILGNEIKTLVNENYQPGEYEIIFSSEDLPSGVYICKLQIENKYIAQKLILLK